MTTTTQQFKTHANLIFSAIQKQSGSFHKAMSELVINSIDAGATKVNIKTGIDGFSVVDDGRGFQSNTEIDEWFATFGTPHVEGDARFGRFRLGRCQIFGWATTEWRTGQFLMNVDMRSRGFDFDLTSDLPPAPGCKITGKFYEPLSLSELDHAERTLTEMLKYVDVPVILNGKQLNTMPERGKWTKVTDEAYFNVAATGGLRLYNMGMLVCYLPSHRFGVSGVIVSKLALNVNTARNEVLESQCPVFKAIAKTLHELSGIQKDKPESLTRERKEFFLKRIARGEMADCNTIMLRLFKTTNDRYVSGNTLSNVAFAEEGSLIADRAMVARRGTVLSNYNLEVMGLDAEGFGKAFEKSFRRKINVMTLEDMTAGISAGCEPVAANKLTKQQSAMLIVVKDMNYQLVRTLNSGLCDEGEDFTVSGRDIRPGSSETAYAWTDGRSTIYVDTKFMEACFAGGIDGLSKLLSTLVHEYSHDDATDGTHVHGETFYTRFHALSVSGGGSGSISLNAAAKYVKLCRKGGFKATAQIRQQIKPLVQLLSSTQDEDETSDGSTMTGQEFSEPMLAAA